MSKVLVLKSSILGEHSQSGKLLDHLIMRWQAQGARMTVRDLVAQPLPALDAEVVSALQGGDGLSVRQQAILALSDALIAELKDHDTLVIAAPMYNFTIPTQLKSWIDLIARAGITFSYTPEGAKGLIEGKRAVLVTTRGGVHRDGPSDHVVPYLKTVLGFIGITEVETIYGEALNMGAEATESAIIQAKQALAQLVA